EGGASDPHWTRRPGAGSRKRCGGALPPPGASAPIVSMLTAPFLFVMLLPSLAAAAVARWAAARAVGMRGVRFLFGGSIENADAAGPWRRAAVAGAALAASYLVAGVFFTAGALTGAYSVRTTRVEVLPGKPAAEAGMETGDRVVSIG